LGTEQHARTSGALETKDLSIFARVPFLLSGSIVVKGMRINPIISSAAVALLILAFLTVVSCSGSSDTADTSSSEGTANTVEQVQATTNDTASPATLSPDPAFDPLLPTLQQMTTAPIMLPASLPSQIESVGIEEKASEADPYATEGYRYSILLLYADTAPNQAIKPYVHYMTAGRITAWPAGAPEPDPTNGLGTPYQLEDVALPDGTVANLERIEPPQGANYGPFTVGTFEAEGERYTVMIENDSPEGDAVRQILSTMVKVPSA
jgi:hypothetical protein